MRRRVALTGVAVAMLAVLPAITSGARAAEAWGPLSEASSLTTHFTPDPNAVAECYWSESGPPGADNGAEYEFLSLTPDDGSTPQYIAIGAYTRTGGAVSVHADTVGLDKDTGLLLPRTGENYAGIDENEVITLRYSDVFNKLKAGTLHWVSASWGDYRLYDCTLTDAGITTPLSTLSADHVGAISLSEFSGGASASAEGGNIGLQASAGAARTYTRVSSGYLLAFLAPAGGLTGAGLTSGGDPSSTEYSYFYGGGMGAIQVAGPEGETSQSIGESPSLPIMASTNGNWTYSVLANAAHATGPALWVAELPS